MKTCSKVFCEISHRVIVEFTVSLVFLLLLILKIFCEMSQPQDQISAAQNMQSNPAKEQVQHWNIIAPNLDKPKSQGVSLSFFLTFFNSILKIRCRRIKRTFSCFFITFNKYPCEKYFSELRFTS